MDGEKLVGGLEMHKSDLLLDELENDFVKELLFDGKVAGKMWFNTKKNANPLFS